MLKSILPGDFLVSSPFLFDPEFAKSVILITHVDTKGYTGIKINHILSPKASQHTTPYNGGPVAKRSGNLLHTPDVRWEKTRDITSNLCITNVDKNTIDIEKDSMPEKYFLVFGFANWNKGQLEDEMMNGFWLTTNADQELIFTIPVVNRWYYAYQSVPISPECVSMDSGRC